MRDRDREREIERETEGERELVAVVVCWLWAGSSCKYNHGQLNNATSVQSSYILVAESQNNAVSSLQYSYLQVLVLLSRQTSPPGRGRGEVSLVKHFKEHITIKNKLKIKMK